MDKLIYLFELDSIIKSKKDMSKALEVMYTTLAIDGDKIALSINQIADSMFFYHWVSDERMKSILTELFRSRRIVIVRQEGFATAREYILSKFSNEEFISSFLYHVNQNYPNEKHSIIRKNVIEALKICNTEKMGEELKNIHVTSEHISSLKNYVRFIIDLCDDEVHYVDETKNSICLTEVIDIAIESLKNKHSKLTGALEYYKSKCNKESRSPWINNIVSDNEAVQRSRKELDNNNLLINDSDLVEKFYSELDARKDKLVKVINTCYNIRVESTINGIENSLLTTESQQSFFMEKFDKYDVHYEVSEDEIANKDSDIFTNEDKKDWTYKKNWEHIEFLCKNI